MNNEQQTIRKNPQIRYLKEMMGVVYDKDFAEKNPNLGLYYIYRGIKKQNGIRYDITVIPPQMLGEEFIRTKGNRNSDDFPELYTVLKGEAIFLMQKTKEKIVQDVVVTKAKKGGYVLVSADYAVIIINASKKELKTGNWVSEKNKNIYEELEKMGGMCYFAITKQTVNNEQRTVNNEIEWVKNPNYKKIPKLRFEKPLKHRTRNDLVP